MLTANTCSGVWLTKSCGVLKNTEVKRPGLWSLSLPQVFLKDLGLVPWPLWTSACSSVQGSLTAWLMSPVAGEPAPHSEPVSALSDWLHLSRCVNHTRLIVCSPNEYYGLAWDDFTFSSHNATGWKVHGQGAKSVNCSWPDRFSLCLQWPVLSLGVWRASSF